MPVRVRFAPSPTGHLHVGNARTALFNWLFARGRGGVFVLRIEDTDIERSTAESEQGIYEDLRWLGLDWDEGPGAGGAHGPYRQSERKDLHAAAARGLLEAGAAYRCFCTVEQLEADRESQRQAGLPPRYTGRCRGLAASDSARRATAERFALRFHVPAESVAFDDLIRGRVEVPASQMGDLVIVRADGLPTYNFAVVLDDIAMEITHVVRGEDHISNTPRQILLYRALGAPAPVFAHVSMVLGPDGSPLSKRHGASSLSDFRERGILPEAMLNYLVLLGWAHPEGREILSADEIASAFSLERVGHAAAMFDMKKLSWLNAHYLRSSTGPRLVASCRAELAAAGFVPAVGGDAAFEDWLGRALQAHAGQMETLADAVAAMRPLFRFSEFMDADPLAAAALGGLAAQPGALDIVSRFADVVESRGTPLLFDKDAFRAAAGEVGRALGVKGRALFHAIRVAVTASDTGPELDRLVPLIDEGAGLSLGQPVVSCGRRARLVAAKLAGARG